MTNITNLTQNDAAISEISRFTFENPLLFLAFIPLAALLSIYVLRRGPSRERIMFLSVRVVLLLLICIAAASPIYITERDDIGDAPPIIVLVDGSPSMGLYPDAPFAANRIFSRVKASFENLTGDSSKVKLEYFSTSNHTAIGDALYNSYLQYPDEPTSIVLFTDGINTRGKDPQSIAQVMGKTNSTLYAVKPDKTRDDILVSGVFGDKKIPSNTRYNLNIQIAYTGNQPRAYELFVYVDGIRKFNKRFTQTEAMFEMPLELRIGEVGIHQIKVEISPDTDSFWENNVYYKTVEVVEKPKVLLITGNKTSPLEQTISELYALSVTNRVDNDYNQFSAVVVDNINAKDLSRDVVNKLRKYILAGNGVAFIGGKNSFEYGGYNNSFIETLLPVKSTNKPSEKRKPLTVYFLIDISGSTSYRASDQAPDTKVNIEKALLLRVLRSLDEKDTVGIAAFDYIPQVTGDNYVFPMGNLGKNREYIEDRVLHLSASSTGGTSFPEPLKHALYQLKDIEGDKYLVLISDGVGGKFRSANEIRSIELATEMRANNIKIMSVGVGFDTNHVFMNDLAKASGGIYFPIDALDRLKLIFGDEADDEEKDRFMVNVLDEYHFITRNLVELKDSSASIKNYNKVQEKNIAQLLLATPSGKPILTVWRFGLGRVAALTTDNGIEWAPEVQRIDSGKVSSAITNWIIGDLEKKKRIRVSSSDTHLGQEIVLTVSSLERPTTAAKEYSTLEETDITLTRTGTTTYEGSFTPQDAGFWAIIARAGSDWDEDATSVNYPLEYLRLGIDDQELWKLAQATQTRLFSVNEEDEIVEDILEKARQYSTKKVKDQTHLWTYFLAAALIIYFLDTVIRRLMVLLRRQI